MTGHAYSNTQALYYWAAGQTALATTTVSVRNTADKLQEGRVLYKLADGTTAANEFTLAASSGGAAITVSGGAAGNVFCPVGGLCPADYHVAGHTCKPCASYYENAAGDDVHHQDTACTRKMCAANEYVTTNGATKVC